MSLTARICLNEIGAGLHGSAIKEGMTVSLCSDTMLGKMICFCYSLEARLLISKYNTWVCMGLHGWEAITECSATSCTLLHNARNLANTMIAHLTRLVTVTDCRNNNQLTRKDICDPVTQFFCVPKHVASISFVIHQKIMFSNTIRDIKPIKSVTIRIAIN